MLTKIPGLKEDNLRIKKLNSLINSWSFVQQEKEGLKKYPLRYING